MNTCRFVIFILCISFLMITSCSETHTSSVRQSRLVAAENLELKKQIDQLNTEIETLKAEQQKELDEQKELLTAAQKEIETWKEKSRQNVRDQIQDVLDSVIQENQDLQKQIEQLKSALETQKARISELEKTLEEKPNQ